VVVDMPAGYSVATPPPGAQVGLAVLTSASPAGETGGSATLVTGIMTADDPSKYAVDPAAQACAPGTSIAVWKLSTTIVGLGYTLPIFVGHPAGDPQGVELRFCPPPLTGLDGKPLAMPPVPLVAVGLLSVPLAEPTAPGSYTSRAFVTAAGPTGAPDPQMTAEARFLRPVPHLVTVKGRYDSKSKAAVLTGRVTVLGKPQPYVHVDYEVVVRTPGGFGVTAPGKRVLTSAAGTFTIRTLIAKTTTFLVGVSDVAGACAGASTAPLGCASETVEGTAGTFARVIVPKR
jgi:hypothetical protein